MQVQSALPLAGDVVCAPIRAAASGPCHFHGVLNVRSRSEFGPPNLPTRSITRLAAPALLPRTSSTPSTELPQKNAACTPESIIAFTCSYIPTDQYSSCPTDRNAFA